MFLCFFFFFQAEDGIRDLYVTGVQTCALPIWLLRCAGAATFAGSSKSTRTGLLASELRHVRASERLLRVKLVVRSAQQANVVEGRGAAEGRRVDVVQLEPPLAPAAPAVRADPRAGTLVAAPDLPANLGRDRLADLGRLPEGRRAIRGR